MTDNFTQIHERVMTTLSVTMGDKEEKSILHDEMESTQDSSEMFGNKEDWLAGAILSSMAQVVFMFVLGRPHQKATILLSFGQACFHLLAPILWNVLFVMTFVAAFISIVKLIQSWEFRVLDILMLCLNFLYGLFKWVTVASIFSVLCYSYRMNGVLFVSIRVLGVMLLCLGAIVLVIFLRGDVKAK
jgi:hypothetical protein